MNSDGVSDAKTYVMESGLNKMIILKCQNIFFNTKK